MVAMPSSQPSVAAQRLAKRLRELREREFGRLTQGDLGRALGGPGPLSPATISMWENAESGRVPPQPRLEAYALLFCTRRAFEGEVHMPQYGELTVDERDRFEELKAELLLLRDDASAEDSAPATGRTRSVWHFPDGADVTLASSRVPGEIRPPYAEPAHLNYVRTAGIADLDALIDIYGAIKAYNPTSKVVMTAAEDLDRKEIPSHLVLIGGRAWQIARRRLARIFPFPIEGDDPYERGCIVVNEPGTGRQEFHKTFDGDELIEDIGFFARGANPSAPKRTLTICAGITTRGVHGAAKCFIEPEMRERNERYLIPRFPPGSAYYIIMRVPVFKAEALTPDLSIAENRLFEWSDAD
jgi:Helix-turn-helix domain